MASIMMTPIKHRMKRITINMKLVNTLPPRTNISIFLSSKGVKKILAIFLLGCFMVLSTSCSRSSDDKAIEVEIWHNGSPLGCNAIESHQQVWSIQQLAFFISNIELSDENIDHQPQLSSTPWQTDDVVLIQPHLSNCDEKLVDEDKMQQDNQLASETLKTNNHLQFLLPVDLDSSEQLSFTLAVPFELNHQNPLLQASPLNLPSMFWSWRSGHKFFRLDMQTPDKSWVFHLGSVGCNAASTMRSPQSECLQPNRVSFNLHKMFDGTKLVMHLDRLIANTSLQSSSSCLFHSGQESCTVLMANLKTQDVFEWH
jgi:uncharacterized repeat protein (TIGR04052 family)